MRTYKVGTPPLALITSPSLLNILTLRWLSRNPSGGTASNVHTGLQRSDVIGDTPGRVPCHSPLFGSSAPSSRSLGVAIAVAVNVAAPDANATGAAAPATVAAVGRSARPYVDQSVGRAVFITWQQQAGGPPDLPTVRSERISHDTA